MAHKLVSHTIHQHEGCTGHRRFVVHHEETGETVHWDFGLDIPHEQAVAELKAHIRHRERVHSAGKAADHGPQPGEEL